MGKIIALINIDALPGHCITGLNFSIALNAHSKENVICVDCSRNDPDSFTTLLNTRPFKRINDILPVAVNGTPDLLRGYLPEFLPGVTAVGSSRQHPEADMPPPDLGILLRFLSSLYPYVIATVPADDEEHLRCIVAASDLVIVLTASELLSLGKVKRFLEQVRSWHLPFSLIKPVLLQMHGISSYLDTESTERYIGLPVLQSISFDIDEIISSVNKSEFSVITAPQSRFSKGLRAIADDVSQGHLFPGAQITAEHHGRGAAATGARPDLEHIKEKIHQALVAQLDINSMHTKGMSAQQKQEYLYSKTRGLIEELAAREPLLTVQERTDLIEEMLSEVLGLGCLEKYLRDPEITEIMVNGHDAVYIEKKGKIHRTDAHFPTSERLLTVIDRIVSPIGRRIDESSPLVDARLADGSRVNVVIPPISLAGPTLTIRKFSRHQLTAGDLQRANALTGDMAQFLKACVQLRKNIVISGGTGSGKTTLLNMLSSYIPADERIVTIEDSAELRLPQDHVVRLEARRPSVEGTGEVSIRHLVINALRMRPDRIVVGECRAGETLDMLQAMNTGHDGSLTTIHANSPHDAIGRISTMVLMSGAELPERAIREQISAAIHLIVQLSRLPDGSRKIVEIAEVTPEGDGKIGILPLFTFNRLGVSEGKVLGTFAATGAFPTFFDDAATRGTPLDKNMFIRA